MRVPAGVGFIFMQHGHTLILFRMMFCRVAPPTTVCVAAEANDALLVAYDNDRKAMAWRHGNHTSTIQAS